MRARQDLCRATSLVWQVSAEPVPGRLRHALEGAALFKQMGGARHDGEFALVRQLAERVPVQRQDFRVRATDDQERRRADTRKRIPGEVRPAASRDHREYALRAGGGGDQRGCGAGAGAEQPERQGGELRPSVQPFDHVRHTPSEQLDVKDIGAVESLLGPQQVKQ